MVFTIQIQILKSDIHDSRQFMIEANLCINVSSTQVLPNW